MGELFENTRLASSRKTGAPMVTTPAKAVSPEPFTGKSSGLERWLMKQLLNALGNPPLTAVLWDGARVTNSPAAIQFRMFIRDRAAFWKVFTYPDLQFGELFTEGRITIDGDLAEFVESINRARRSTKRRPYKHQFFDWLYRPGKNTLARARDNIYHHYDIGNAFYRLWLDKELIYTCAYFADASMGLEAAQIAKMDHVCRKLRLKPGERVVEAGCGWGALARHMARNYGVTVRAYNISKEQLAHAREMARKEGLEDKVEFVEGDYREIHGEYDAFVSVGMLEHVGIDNYGELGKVIDQCLSPSGRGLIHTIGHTKPGLMNAWIERRIFPGACPPSLGEMAGIFEPYDFSVLDVENIRLHYALTLEHWSHRFENNVGKVRAMFDDSFIRAWRLYLSGSIAAFRSGDLQLFQVVFNRGESNEVSWTRDHLYRKGN
jgi:cyclopropane-fatty-acyl-phospholipid synthase